MPNCLRLGRGAVSMTPRPAPQNFGRRWRALRIRATCSTRRSSTRFWRSSRPRPSTRKGRWLASTKRWLSLFKSNSAAISPSCIASAAKSCSSAIPPIPAPAEEAYLTAIAIANEQGARSFGLRAALSLAKLYQSTARPADAHAVLAPALEGFAPTPEMPEIAEAQALLAALAETEEVKSAEAQRERRLHLQTAYGQAMMWAKGFAAEETKGRLRARRRVGREDQ